LPVILAIELKQKIEKISVTLLRRVDYRRMCARFPLGAAQQVVQAGGHKSACTSAGLCRLTCQKVSSYRKNNHLYSK